MTLSPRSKIALVVFAAIWSIAIFYFKDAFVPFPGGFTVHQDYKTSLTLFLEGMGVIQVGYASHRLRAHFQANPFGAHSIYKNDDFYTTVIGIFSFTVLVFGFAVSLT